MSRALTKHNEEQEFSIQLVEPKRSDFKKNMEALQAYYEDATLDLDLSAVEEDGWFFGLNDHTVTGAELNARLNEIVNAFSQIETFHAETLDELQAVYKTFEKLDSEYIASIIANIQAIRKVCEETRNTQNKLRATQSQLLETQQGLVDNQAKLERVSERQGKVIDVLSNFKTKLDAIKHLEHVDAIWGALNQIHEAQAHLEERRQAIAKKEKELDDRLEAFDVTLVKRIATKRILFVCLLLDATALIIVAFIGLLMRHLF